MKKRIGIVGWSTGDGSFGATKPYLNYFSTFGQVEIITPREDMMEGLDLLVLPGGLDTDPANYGEVPGFYTSNSDVFKDYFMTRNLEQYISKGVPVFGICLGAQQLNVHFGGKLVQHYPFPYSKSRDELVEEVLLTPEMTKYLVLKKGGKFKMNSLHHQGFFPDQAAEMFNILAVSAESKNVEIFEHKYLPIFGYQGHPEESHCNVATILINKLLSTNEKV